MTILITPGPFTSARLVPPALATLVCKPANVAEVRMTRQFDESAEWSFGLDIPSGVVAKNKQWYGLTAEEANDDSVSACEYFQEGDKIPLATCGLIWRDYGRAIISKIQSEDGLPEIREDLVAKAHRKVYESTIQALDARVQGIKRCDVCTESLFDNWTSYDKAIMCLDPWMEGISRDAAVLQQRHEALQTAVAETARVLRELIRRILVDWVPGYQTVQEAMTPQEQCKQGDQLVIVLKRFVPWRDHLYAIEEEQNMTEEDQQVKWVVFQDERSGQWRATAPAKRGERFANRALFHEDLRGLRDEELVTKAMVEGANFIHHSGFTGGASTLEGVLKLISYGH